MATKEISFKTKGMARDSAVSAFSPLFAYENMNMRYQTNEDNSLMAMTTEKSTKFINSLPGIVIGCCTIENQIVAFTTIKKEAKEVSTDKPDSIFLIYESTEADNEEQNIKNGYQYKLLYNGNLNFDANHPIEAIPYIETQKAKKVFWTDYKNPIRCINIATDANGLKLWKDTSFDFNLNYTTVAQGTVTKLYQPGMFPAGVIQYVATYFNKYGAESNIIWYSPLLYITPQGRAGAPDEVCSNAFKVSLNNLDNTSAEYVRLYSIVRTTLDATPIVKRVVDLKVSEITLTNEGVNIRQLIKTDSPISLLETYSTKLPQITFNVFTPDNRYSDITVTWPTEGTKKGKVLVLQSILKGEIQDTKILSLYGFPTYFGGIYFKDPNPDSSTTPLKTGYAKTASFNNSTFRNQSPYNKDWTIDNLHCDEISAEVTEIRVSSKDLIEGIYGNYFFFLPAKNLNMTSYTPQEIPQDYKIKDNDVYYPDFVHLLISSAKKYFETDGKGSYVYNPSKEDLLFKDSILVLRPASYEVKDDAASGGIKYALNSNPYNSYMSYVILIKNMSLQYYLYKMSKVSDNSSGTTAESWTIVKKEAYATDSSSGLKVEKDLAIYDESSDAQEQWTALITSDDVITNDAAWGYTTGTGMRGQVDSPYPSLTMYPNYTPSANVGENPLDWFITNNFQGLHCPPELQGVQRYEYLCQLLTPNGVQYTPLFKVYYGQDAGDIVDTSANVIPDSVSTGYLGYFINTVTIKSDYSTKKILYEDDLGHLFNHSPIKNPSRLLLEYNPDVDEDDLKIKSGSLYKEGDEIKQYPESLNIDVKDESGKSYHQIYYYTKTLKTEITKTFGFTYIDNNTQGDTISDTELLFKEKTPFTAKTLTTKNNSLFLGNIKLLLSNILLDVKPTDEGEAFAYKGIVGSVSCTTEDRVLDSTTGLGKNLNELWSTLDYDSYKISCFKRHETYRLGVQLLYKDSSWSTVIPIGDYEMTEISDTKKKSVFTSTIDSRLRDEFMAVRPVIVYPDINQRSCMFLGAVCPTVFNLGDRRDNSPFSLMSWFCRPQKDMSIRDEYGTAGASIVYSYEASSIKIFLGPAIHQFYQPDLLEDLVNNTNKYFTYDVGQLYILTITAVKHAFDPYYLSSHTHYLAGDVDYAEFRHWAGLKPNNSSNAEIQNLAFFYPWDKTKATDNQPISNIFLNASENQTRYNQIKDLLWYVDRSIVTMHSPEVLWLTNIQNYDTSAYKFRIVGKIKLNNSLTTTKIQLDNTTTQADVNKRYVGYDESSLTSFTVANPTTLFGKGLLQEQVYLQQSNEGWKQPLATAIFNDFSAWKGTSSEVRKPLQILGAVINAGEDKSSAIKCTEVSDKGDSTTDGQNFLIYPWHKLGAVNKRQGIPNDNKFSVLKKHITAYYKKSDSTDFISTMWTPANNCSCIIYNGVNAANSNKASISGTMFLRSQVDGHSYNKYYSNVDKIVTFSPGVSYLYNPLRYNPTADTVTFTAWKDDENNELPTIKRTVKSYPVYVQPISVIAAHYFKGPLGEDGKYGIGDIAKPTNRDDVLKVKNWPYIEMANCGADNNTLEDKIEGDTAPVRILYKSLPHAVISFNYKNYGDTYGLVILPEFPHIQNVDYRGEQDPFYNVTLNDDVFTIYNDNGWNGYKWYNTNDDYGYLWLGEIYRDMATPFGGNTETQFKNHNWCIAGDAVAIPDSGTTEIKWILGDTYVGRFESQRIEPSTEDDLNQMVDMVSFICESRINMDGVYDRNRNLKDYTYIRSTNFNKLNEVYSQTASYFRQQYVQKDDDINTFPTLIAFSLSKSLGEETDSWMNMTLNSITDADGRLGEINKLCNFNDTIIVFQKNGIEQLMYNSNVQIQSTQGVPIEIANSQKVDGLRVLSDTIGCANKHALVQTDRGIYFVATDLKGLYVFTGQLANLSDSQGFRAWFKNRDSNTEWTPVSKGATLYYYEKMGDIFYNDGEDCLAFNQPLGQFSSFYSYELGGQLVNINGKGIQFVRRLSRWATMKESETYFYELRGGEDYGKYFSESKILSSGITPNFNPASPSYTIVVANADVDKDKVFNNLEYRADVLKLDEDYDKQTLEVNKEAVKPLLKNRPKYPFDKLSVWNEYQQGSSTLSDKFGKPSNLKAKFRIWKANIPRDGNSFRGNRMRNPWIFLKLENSASNIRNNNFCKTVLHDMKVYYYEQ